MKHGIKTMAGAAALVMSCGGDSAPADPCAELAIEGACVGLPTGSTAEEIDAAFNDAVDGVTLAFGAGTFSFTTDLSLVADGVTVIGQGDATLLDFSGQATGAQGILATGDDVTFQDFKIADSAGDAIKVEGADGVTFRGVTVTWNDGVGSSQNGAYGLYPVQCQNVLIEGCTVSAASDAGIYVGQSDNVVVRDNVATGNVAGIEIENTKRADVYGNDAHDNTGGILVFNLPGLETGNGTQTRVFDNDVAHNNTENFAPEGNIVGKVPAGTGVVVLAANAVEIYGNRISDHIAAPVGVISYLPIDAEVGDPLYDMYPTDVYVHDNELTGVATMPTGELGALLILGISEYNDGAPIVVPGLTWDGAVDPAREASPGVYPADLKICFKNNTGDADFLNLHFPTGASNLPLADNDASVVDCTQPAQPEVVLE